MSYYSSIVFNMILQIQPGFQATVKASLSFSYRHLNLSRLPNVMLFLYQIDFLTFFQPYRVHSKFSILNLIYNYWYFA